MPGRIVRGGRGRYVVQWGRRRFRHRSAHMAAAQLRLLRAIEHGWRPSRRRRPR